MDRLITSAANPEFRRLKSLESARYMRKHGLCAVHGWRFCRELLLNGQARPRIVALHERLPAPTEASTLDRVLLARDLFEQLDIFGTAEPIVFFELPELDILPVGASLQGCNVLLPFQNPDNLGAAIRTAVAFGAKVILTPESANPFLPKCIRASAGAVFGGRILQARNLSDLDLRSVARIGLDAQGNDLTKVTLPQDCLLIPGVEGPGLTYVEVCDQVVAIPMPGKIESLNANVAVSILLYEYFRQRQAGV
jgi:tRNA G18 (ribose-2'-O)-methylase SpoU